MVVGRSCMCIDRYIPGSSTQHLFSPPNFSLFRSPTLVQREEDGEVGAAPHHPDGEERRLVVAPDLGWGVDFVLWWRHNGFLCGVMDGGWSSTRKWCIGTSGRTHNSFYHTPSINIYDTTPHLDVAQRLEVREVPEGGARRDAAQLQPCRAADSMIGWFGWLLGPGCGVGTTDGSIDRSVHRPQPSSPSTKPKPYRSRPTPFRRRRRWKPPAPPAGGSAAVLGFWGLGLVVASVSFCIVLVLGGQL